MTLRKFLVMLGAATVIAMVFMVWFFPSSDDLGTENPFWNGTGDLSSGDLVVPIASLSELPSSPQGVTLILVPCVNFTVSELGELSRFITRGGTLVLADDYGFGNQVLEYLGMEERFSGQALLDPLFNYRNKRLPRVYSLSSGPITGGTESLVLNHATCLDYVKEDDVLAYSSSFAFLDTNDSGNWEEGEPTGPLPVISRHDLAEGQVILFSDPSIFINSMQTIEGNYRIIQNLVRVTESTILIDQSHLHQSDLPRAKDFLTDVRSILATPTGTLVLAVVLLVVALKPIWYRKGDEIEQTGE